MREGAVRPVLDAVAAVVGVVHAHARLVILEVVPPLRVARRPVQERAAGRREKNRICTPGGRFTEFCNQKLILSKKCKP